ncbi:unnamed protein product [Mesocestoides corti]|uniref:DUF3677 domain-containing protein n=1 Tax=Mesocestoides corti TaxID=53468 RepID=A0A158QV97_MESCO|nr:unnamed protein product [Mesocestoides corti]
MNHFCSPLMPSSEFVSRVESLLASGNLPEAEALIVAVLNQIRENIISTPSVGTSGSLGLPRPSGHAHSSSRLPPAYSLGLLVIAKHQNAPGVFSRSYLEDSLSDRVWVDLDECKAFVLNLETAFPPVVGDPRSLFAVLCSSSQLSAGVQAALGLTTTGTSLHQPTSVELPQNTESTVATDLTDAVSAALQAAHLLHPAKIIHGGDPSRMVSNRFESGRAAVDVIILNTLREALSRRGTVSTNLGLSATPAETSSGSGASGVSLPSTGEVVYTRCLIRTLAMTSGLAEVRSLSAQRLEPWLTNPKLQIMASGLLTILALNCKQGMASPFDIDVMITLIFRIRLKLLKVNIQSSVLESVCRLVCSNPSNLSSLIKLCLASELPTISAISESYEQAAKHAEKQPQPQLPSLAAHSSVAPSPISSPSAKCLAATVRSMCSQSGEHANDPSLSSNTHSNLISANANLVAVGAAEAVAKGHTAVPFILPKLYQRFPVQWAKVRSTPPDNLQVIHDRIIEAVTCAGAMLPVVAGGLPAHPTDSQLVAHIVRLFAPTRQLLRELSKWMKMTASAPQSPPDFLPCSELGFGLLLLDRSSYPAFPESAASVAQRLLSSCGSQNFGPFTILKYIYAVVHVICQLQLLSVTRPNLCDAPAARKKLVGSSDAVKQHQACVRQLRLNFLRWFKSFVPHLISSAASHFPANAPRDAFADISLLLRRAFFLEVAAPFDDSVSSGNFSAFYAAEELWPAEQNQRPFICHLTYVNLPEKLAIHVLRYGLESQWGLVSPSDVADIVCELIWRSTALSIDNGYESSNFTKLEDMIDLLYACCAYCTDREVPSELTELGFKESYWKVSLALVALAAHSPKTCGAHLWINYPTVRMLMEMVITNNFTYPPLNAAVDTTSVESERLNKELETQMILRLESYLSGPSAEVKRSSDEELKTGDIMKREKVEVVDHQLPIITPTESKMIGQLVRNNPRGACRCPPDDQIATLKRLCEQLGLRRRLCSCRQPDLLLELISSQGNKSSSCVCSGLPQPWVIQLVESMWQNIDTLPLQCLAEYLLYSSIQRVQVADEKAFTSGLSVDTPFSVVSRRSRKQSTSSTDANHEITIDLENVGPEGPVPPRRVRLDSSASVTHAPEKSSSGAGQTDFNRRRLHSRILERLRGQARGPPAAATVTATSSPAPVTGTESQDSVLHHQLVDNVAKAMLQSFAFRLKDSSSLVRRAARFCLTFLAVEDVASTSIKQPAPGQLTQPVEELLSVLQSLVSLPGLSVAVDKQQMQPLDPGDPASIDFLDLVLEAILVEDDIASLIAYIIFLGQLTENSLVAWRPSIGCLSQLILNRKALVQCLFSLTDLMDIQPPMPPHQSNSSHRDDQEANIRKSAGFIVLENISRILALDVDYYCTSANVIPVNEKNSVFVAWSPSRQCPMELEVIESHLVLLSRIPKRFTGGSCSSWWGHLLDIWFVYNADGVATLPDMVSLTSSSSAEPLHTKRGLVSLTVDNKLSLSAELKAAFVTSGLPQLISTALSDTHPDELLQIICTIPPMLLDANIATRLVDLANELHVIPSTPKQTILVEALRKRARQQMASGESNSPVLATSRVFANPHISPPVLTPKKRVLSPLPSPHSRQPVPASNEPEADSTSVALDTQEPPSGSRNLWRVLLSRLVEVGDNFAQLSDLFCCTLARIKNSPATRNKWMQDLTNELQSPLLSPKRGKTGSSAVTLVDLFDGLPKNSAVNYALTLVRSCLTPGISSSDAKLAGRYQKSMELCIGQFEQKGFSSPLMELLLLRPLKLLTTKKPAERIAKSNEPLESGVLLLIADQLQMRQLMLSCAVMAQLKTLLIINFYDRKRRIISFLYSSFNPETFSSSLEHQMESLSVFGASSALSPSTKARALLGVSGSHSVSVDPPTHHLWTVMRYLIFENTAEINKKKYCLLEELVHNNSASILRVCLHNVLQEDVNAVSSSLVLDFVTCVLNLPAFSSPVPLAEPHMRPDPGSAYTLFHRLMDPIEGMRLIAHVHIEASGVSDLRRDQTIAGRAPLIDLALQCYLQPCLHFVEYLAGFLDTLELLPSDLAQPALKEEGNQTVARRLLLCLYLRRPGLIGSLKSHNSRKFLRKPVSSGEIPSCFEYKEVSLLGPSFLIGLSGSSDVVRETSLLSSLALAVHHPRLCLRLLPLISCLSQGRLDTSLAVGSSSSTGNLSWGKFVARHHIDFYTGLLQFMEVLAFTKDQEGTGGVLFCAEAEMYMASVDGVLSSLIHVAASYPNHVTKMAGGFGNRLSRLLQSYARHASWAHSENGLFGADRGGVGRDGKARGEGNRTRLEMLRLANLFHELSCLVPLMANYSVPSGRQTFLPLPLTPPKTPKHCNAAVLKPFIQRLRHSANFVEVYTILSDLDALTERKTEALVYFQAELEHLVTCPQPEWQRGVTVDEKPKTSPSLFPLLFKLLFRLLRHSPEKAGDSLLSFFLPCLSGRGTKTDVSAALDHLPEACLLAPHLAPCLLHAAAFLVCTKTNANRSRIISSVSQALVRMSLDGVNAACIEHAASGLLNTATGPKFAVK